MIPIFSQKKKDVAGETLKFSVCFCKVCLAVLMHRDQKTVSRFS